MPKATISAFRLNNRFLKKLAQDSDSKTFSTEFAGQVYSRLGKTREIISQKKIWHLADELPLVLFYNSEQLGVMMITPSDIEDFCIGFSLNEGVVKSASQISDIRLETVADGMIANIIVPKEALTIARERKRTITAGSSCGICGAQTLAAVLPKPQKNSALATEPNIALVALKSIGEKQLQNQKNFSTHAAALADREGKIILLREDVGRHNALDKLCGAMAQNQLTAQEGFLVLTSRLSLEMVQKATIAGFSQVATISAPTALAVKIAKQANLQIMTLSTDDLMVFS